MKDWLKKTLPFAMFAAAVVMFLAAVSLRDRVPEPLLSALCVVGGILMGSGSVGSAQRGLTPEQEKEIERGETDERNIAIREKAAMSSWYWTLYLLWAAFIVVEFFVGGRWGVAVSVLIVLHCTFYMINIHRWNKKM